MVEFRRNRHPGRFSWLLILSAFFLAIFLIYLLVGKHGNVQGDPHTRTTGDISRISAGQSGTTRTLTLAPSQTLTPSQALTPSQTSAPSQTLAPLQTAMPEVLTGNVRLKVPFVSQWPELPTGCEITAAAMLLQYYGLPADKYDMAWNYLDINSYFYYDEFGVLFGPDPNDYFIGDPETFGGYGCFAPVIVRSMNRYLQDRNSSLTAYNMTGCLFSDLIGWLEKGMPVLVWASGYMTDLFISDSWMLPSGERFTWPGNEHCLVLTGYDENGLWFNDPLMDQEAYGILQYSAEAFATYWQFLGRQTILIR